MTLNQLRKRIDRIDRDVLRLLNQRAALALRIGEFKKKRGLPVFDGRREEEVLRRLMRASCGPLPPSASHEIFRVILRLSRRLQVLKSGRGKG
ncbi:MAG: chorismate mutase [Candidatus Omnitrophica bacterium]|nr:chorismate mutase [Candidatus Omnitrophota bacterium]